MALDKNLTGYGPSSLWQNLVFNGDERKFEVWETKILGYMKLKKLKKFLLEKLRLLLNKMKQLSVNLYSF